MNPLDPFEETTRLLQEIADQVVPDWKRHVLMLDDHEGMRELVESVFKQRKAPYAVHKAATGEEADEILKTFKIHFAIVDWKLPGTKTGLDWVAYWKKLGMLECEWVLISGEASGGTWDDVHDKANQMGASKILLKGPGSRWLALPTFIEQTICEWLAKKKHTLTHVLVLLVLLLTACPVLARPSHAAGGDPLLPCAGGRVGLPQRVWLSRHAAACHCAGADVGVCGRALKV